MASEHYNQKQKQVESLKKNAKSTLILFLLKKTLKTTNDVCEDNVRMTTYTISDNSIIFEANGQKRAIPFSVKDNILTITTNSITQIYKKNARKVMA